MTMGRDRDRDDDGKHRDHNRDDGKHRDQNRERQDRDGQKPVDPRTLREPPPGRHGR
jgi:hypothetical protein